MNGYRARISSLGIYSVELLVVISIIGILPDFFEGVSGELKLGPEITSNSGHTVWCDGRVHHAGFTTVFTPNTRVVYTLDGVQYDIDYTSQQEGRDLDLFQARFCRIICLSIPGSRDFEYR